MNEDWGMEQEERCEKVGEEEEILIASKEPEGGREEPTIPTSRDTEVAVDTGSSITIITIILSLVSYCVCDFLASTGLST